MKIHWIPILLWFACSKLSVAQDSLKTTDLETVVVTATRNERTLDAVPMPVTLVTAPLLKSMGSLRLQDALSEQTGLVIVPQVNAQGNGLQLQGMNPDYTLILIDGEPLIGRYTGSLELNRIAVGNIRQIEIVKGPSSSLYGSEALAGVVNIITENPSRNSAQVFSRYGTNSTSDFSVQGSHAGGKLSANIFADRYQTNGYDLSPDKFGKTVSPFTNYTVQGKIKWRPTNKTELSLSARNFSEVQQFGFEVASGNLTTRTFGNGMTRDWNINPVLIHRFNDNFKMSARFYYTHYQTETALDLETSGEPYYQDDFNQGFMRGELVGHASIAKRQFLTFGIGNIRENVRTSRYGDENRRDQQTSYVFLQHEWRNPDERLQFISGIRLDDNSVYGTQMSPKFSASYRVSKRITWRMSTGVGFKAPDFRQLYFNFTNSAAGGYSVLGTQVVRQKLADLEAAGQIETYFFDPATLSAIQAERSLAVNAGADVRISPVWSMHFNFFRNQVSNLIETQAVAATTSGQNIYTYRNINRALTEGLELNADWRVQSNLRISAGYQLLFAMDRDVLDRVRDGKVFYRSPGSLTTRQLPTLAYHGLYNRSRHHLNLKAFYKASNGLEATVRLIGRSRFGIGDIRGNIQGETIPASDINGNAILDVYDRFIPGTMLLNVSAGKNWNDRIILQAGVDNLFNRTEPLYMPNLPGRLAWISITWTIRERENSTTK